MPGILFNNYFSVIVHSIEPLDLTLSIVDKKVNLYGLHIPAIVQYCVSAHYRHVRKLSDAQINDSNHDNAKERQNPGEFFLRGLLHHFKTTLIGYLISYPRQTFVEAP